MRGLYVHIPFCEHKCIYCDFYSIEQTGMIDEFVDSLIGEIDRAGRTVQEKRQFTSLFFGGGTPSLLTPAQLESIVDALHRQFMIAPDAEFTLESNPGTITAGRLREYRSLGVNRLSIGIQSFHDDDLAFLTRIHSAEQAAAGYRNARAAGFDNVNIDLMFSMPGQTRERWEQNLQRAIELGPDHISAYSLTYEHGTPLHSRLMRGEITPLADEMDAELYALTIDMLEGADYIQYEISNYARGEKICMHNWTYWDHHEYLGFGPSAHSFYEGRRFWNIRNLREYMRAVRDGVLPVLGEETLTHYQYVEELIFLGLRTRGIDLKRLKDSYNFNLLIEKARQIASLQSRGLLTLDEGRLRVTRAGLPFADLIASELM
jgi:oxygen-independent coproporphyrinogen III oxidase